MTRPRRARAPVRTGPRAAAQPEPPRPAPPAAVQTVAAAELRSRLCELLESEGDGEAAAGERVLEAISVLGEVDIREGTPGLEADEESYKAALSGAWAQALTTLDDARVGSVTTLGRLSFGTLHPLELEVRVEEVVQLLGPHLSDDGRANAYDTCIAFSVVGEDPPLRGRVIAKAAFAPSAADRNRLDVTFLGTTLAPVDRREVTAGDRWVEVFLAANPGLDRHTGDFQAPLTGQPEGHVDVIYLDERFRVTRGNRGSVVVVVRAEHAPPWATEQAS